jgi:hypothetical protein
VEGVGGGVMAGARAEGWRGGSWGAKGTNEGERRERPGRRSSVRDWQTADALEGMVVFRSASSFSAWEEALS